MTSGVYTITNMINGKRYIGSAARIDARFRQHLKALRRGVHHSVKLRRAWEKYGSAAFAFDVLEYVEPAQLLSAEQRWIDYFQAATHSGYNVCKTAGSHLGMECSAETRNKLAVAGRGRRHTPEALAKMRGRVCSVETRARMGVARRGQRRSVEARARMSAARKGHQHSPETKAKIAAAMRGRRLSPETRSRMSIAQRGIGCSVAARAKISATKRSRRAVAGSVIISLTEGVGNG